jgi:hypothetical protein
MIDVVFDSYRNRIVHVGVDPISYGRAQNRVGLTTRWNLKKRQILGRRGGIKQKTERDEPANPYAFP